MWTFPGSAFTRRSIPSVVGSVPDFSAETFGIFPDESDEVGFSNARKLKSWGAGAEIAWPNVIAGIVNSAKMVTVTRFRPICMEGFVGQTSTCPVLTSEAPLQKSKQDRRKPVLL